MKFTCPVASLAPAVARAIGAITPRSTLPILSHLLLRPAEGGGTLAIRGTDLEVDITHCLPIPPLAEPAPIALPGAKLHAILRTLSPGQELCLETDARHRATLTAGNSRFTLSGLDPEEYPPHPAHQPGLALTVEAAELRRALHRVAHAMSNNADRPTLCGVLLEWQDPETLVLVTTDGRRLARQLLVSADLETRRPDAPTQVILPAHAVRQCLATLPAHGGEEVAFLSWGPHYLRLRCGSGEVLARLVEGTYPPYRSVLPPADSGTGVEIPLEAWAGAVRRLALLATEKFPGITIRFGLGTAHLSVASGEGTEGGREELSTVTRDPGLVEKQTCLNHEYLAEALAAAAQAAQEPEVVELRYVDALSPLLLVAGPDYQEVLMPIRQA